MDEERARSLERARRDERPVLAADGEPLGRVDALYYDLESGEPEWLGVATEGLARRLVPASEASILGDAVQVPYDRERVVASPEVDEEEIGEELEATIRGHYELPKPLEERDTAVLPGDACPRVVDRDGESLGELERVYYADDTGEPAWLGVRTGSEPSRRVLVPVAGAWSDGDALHVPHAQEAVAATPPVEDERIDRPTHEALAEHYGIAVGPRLRKRVEDGREEREVERTVERAEIERVPVEGEDSGLVETLPDGSVSVPVFEEELVVTKRRVVRERVIVRKETAVEVEIVGADVLRERVDGPGEA